MPYIAYENWNPSPKSASLVGDAKEIISEYRAQGYLLTLRQLYYQFVARGLIENTQRSYKNIGSLIAKARMAGLIDWSAIEDRTRNLTNWRTYDGPEEAIRQTHDYYTLQKWARQPTYVEVWVEKEALSGVFERICSQLEVPFFACRGYVSLSEMWSASRRLKRKAEGRRDVTILHFGDHDPSGMDMTRDIGDRKDIFAGFNTSIEVVRIALNMDQVDEYSPPPNPAKMSDSRAEDYVLQYGYDSWELDALEPSVLSDLVEAEVLARRNQTLWDEAEEEEAEHKETLQLIEANYDEVAEFVEGLS